MSEILDASIKERLWHKMRSDLAKFVPEVAENNLLMCCTCGRFLPQDDFTLEHLIPKQALKNDPPAVRVNPATSANVRSGNLLLCKRPLYYKQSPLYQNGCNSWKGKHYDRPIAELLSARAVHNRAQKPTDTHIIAGLSLAYLAAVAEYGYVITLMRSGLTLREQFFNPRRFRPTLGTRHQIVLSGDAILDPTHAVWTKPFSFSFERNACLVTMRNVVAILPISRNPFAPVARHLKIVPQRFTFRPDLRTTLE